MDVKQGNLQGNQQILGDRDVNICMENSTVIYQGGLRVQGNCKCILTHEESNTADPQLCNGERLMLANAINLYKCAIKVSLMLLQCHLKWLATWKYTSISFSN